MLSVGENRTIGESPCRSFGGASSRRFRETWLRCWVAESLELRCGMGEIREG